MCPHRGCGFVSVLQKLQKHPEHGLAEEFWTGSARVRAAGCVSCRTPRAVFVLRKKLFCIVMHRAWWWELRGLSLPPFHGQRTEGP